MNKAKLDVSNLKVETFEAGEDPRAADFLACSRAPCTKVCLIETCEEYGC